MSRIGKKPILIPEKVTADISGQTVSVTGPKGSLTRVLHRSVTASVVDTEDGKAIVVSVANPDAVDDRAQWGTARANIANLIEGVSNGFSRALEVNGVGFRVGVQGNVVTLNIGFSHDVQFSLPSGVSAAVEKNVITLSGADRELVGQTAAHLRKLKVPEPYKGKGIKYVDEVIRRKAGKAAKAGE